MDLYVNGNRFLLEQLQGNLYSQSALNDYEYKTLDFIRDWLSDKETFQLKTSGSTGVPKEIWAPRTFLDLSANNTNRILGLKSGYNALICLNIEFIAGKMMLIRSLLQGMNMYVVEPSRNPFELYSADFDFMAVVPLQLDKWLKEPEETRRLNCFKKIIVGGAPISVALKQKCASLVPDVYETYGMTETFSHIALKNIKTENCFTTIYPDIELAVDERSCLRIKGAITNDKWLQTNDLVDLIDHNMFELKGRADFVINSGGIKISPEEIEGRISEHCTFSSNFVISSVFDVALGEALVLVLEQNSPLEDLQFDFLEKYKRPKKIIYLDKFPLTNSGKVDRKEIKKNIFTS